MGQSSYNTRVRVHLTNLGCKLNQAEVEAMARGFSARGHEVVDEVADADVHVINTCTVTHVADRSSRKAARRSSRDAPHVRTVVTGCYATAKGLEAKELAGVELVVPNDRKDQLVGEVEKTFPELAGLVTERESPYGPLGLTAGRARAAVKIEDGCNMTCSFCIIPFTRGNQVSRHPDEVCDEIGRLVAAGLREIVLTGVQISSYRHGDLRLVDLVNRIRPLLGSARLRLTSIAPWNFDSRLFGLLERSEVCPHIHLSLQSGCDATLERMKRPYTVAQYEELVDRIRTAQPHVAITTDVIVGFPGETDEDFADSLSAVGRMGFAKIHAFPYSRRQQTRAANMEGQVHPKMCRERMEQLLEVAREAEARFRRRQAGRELDVLWEGADQDHAVGTSGNYVKVLGSIDRAHWPGVERARVSMDEGGALWTA